MEGKEKDGRGEEGERGELLTAEIDFPHAS